MTPTEGRARRVAHNTLFLYSAEAAARLLAGLVFIYLTRRWAEVGTYGQYALVVNWIAILAVFSEWGLNALVVREVAHRKDRALFYLHNAVAIRMLFSILFWAGLIALAFVLGYEPVLKLGLLVMGFRVILEALASGYVYLLQAHEMMGYYSLVNILASFLRLVGIVVVVEAGGGIVAACSVWAAVSSVSLVVLMARGWKLGWKFDFSQLRLEECLRVLRKAFPLASFGIMQILYYRVNSILLKSLSGNEAVGYFDLANKILLFILIFSTLFGTAFYPALSSARDDDKAFSRMVGKAIKFLLVLGLPATVGGFLLAQPLVLLASGPKYLPSVPILAALMLSVAPLYLSQIYSNALAIYNPIRLNLQFGALLALNLVLNFTLIPRMGGEGAAWATVFCEYFGIILGFWLVAPYIKNIQWASVGRTFLAVLGATLAMGAGIWLDPRLYWLALGPLVYGISFLIFRGFDQEDWESLHSIFVRENQ